MFEYDLGKVRSVQQHHVLMFTAKLCGAHALLVVSAPAILQVVPGGWGFPALTLWGCRQEEDAHDTSGSTSSLHVRLSLVFNLPFTFNQPFFILSLFRFSTPREEKAIAYALH